MIQNKLTINYTYYQNANALKLITDHYGDYSGCNFQIIDDGSSPPINLNVIPKHWSVYRINEDIGWNNEGARNVLIETTKTEWNVLVDMDFIISIDDIIKINEYIQLLDSNKLYRFVADGHISKHTINSFMISKTLFDEHGGYDRALLGFYGNDISLLSKISNTDLLDTIRLQRILPEVFSFDKESEKKKYKAYIIKLMEEGIINFQFSEGITGIGCFEWKNKKVHEQHFKKFTWSRIQ